MNQLDRDQELFYRAAFPEPVQAVAAGTIWREDRTQFKNGGHLVKEEDRLVKVLSAAAPGCASVCVIVCDADGIELDQRLRWRRVDRFGRDYQLVQGVLL